MSICIEAVHRTDRDQSRLSGEHTQVVVKVNAEVDERVAPLVSALNEFDGVITLDSCQGDACQMAYVYFTRTGTANGLLSFVNELAGSLNARLSARQNEYELVLEWTAGTEKPLAVLRTRPDYLSELANALSDAARAHKKQLLYSK
jgi:hypothetical protein